MTPTPEQIEQLEIARTAAEDTRGIHVAVHHLRNVIQIVDALTAAAGVGKGGLGAFPEDDPRPGAFHAAAGAREPEYLYDKEKRTLSKYQQVVNATIERCAQVAETTICKEQDAANRIAAAIRALKDKP